MARHVFEWGDARRSPYFYIPKPGGFPALNETPESSSGSREGSAADSYTVVYGGEVGRDNADPPHPYPTFREEDEDEDGVVVISDSDDDSVEELSSWTTPAKPPPNAYLGGGYRHSMATWTSPRLSGWPFSTA